MSDERIITAAVITSSEKGDGQHLEALVEKSEKAGMEIDTILEIQPIFRNRKFKLPKKRFRLVSKLHPVIANGTRKKMSFYGFLFMRIWTHSEIIVRFKIKKKESL